VRDPTGAHEPAAFLSTEQDATPATIRGWFVSRWRVETTFQEVRAHLGIENVRISGVRRRRASTVLSGGQIAPCQPTGSPNTPGS
jgi:hypothetical protein